jgi:hypothetical protein
MNPDERQERWLHIDRELAAIALNRIDQLLETFQRNGMKLVY